MESAEPAHKLIKEMKKSQNCLTVLSATTVSSLAQPRDAAARGCIACTGDAAVPRAGGGRQRARTGECRDRAVLTGTILHLLLEEPLPLECSLSQRATLDQEPPSLQIRAVTQADSSVYSALIENSDGCICTKCFHSPVSEPVGCSCLETRMLHQEQERCCLPLSCTVPGDTAVSYSQSRDREPLSNQSVLEMPKDVQTRLYVCNMSNPANWSMPSIDTATASKQKELLLACLCPAVFVFLVLLFVAIPGFKTRCMRNRRNDDPECSSPLGAGNCLRRAGDGSAPGC